MKPAKQLVSLIIFSSALIACSPGIYTGGGLTESAGPGGDKAGFGLEVKCGEPDDAGYFSLVDDGWEIPVEMSAHVMDFGDHGDFGHDCNLYATLEYNSVNPDYPGGGQAVVCFGEDLEMNISDAYGDVWVSVQSGPFEGYENSGPVFGNMLSQQCGS